VASSPVGELAYWQAALAAVLLAWPVTWAMNAVWLLPAALVVACAWPPARAAASRAWLLGCAAGLLLAAVPDSAALLVLGRWASFKYVLGESLVFLSLLAVSVTSARTPAERPR
jgi:hypothetical protein